MSWVRSSVKKFKSRDQRRFKGRGVDGGAMKGKCSSSSVRSVYYKECNGCSLCSLRFHLDRVELCASGIVLVGLDWFGWFLRKSF